MYLTSARWGADGSHIKGLIINLFHYYWPNLLRSPGFLQEVSPPSTLP